MKGKQSIHHIHIICFQTALPPRILWQLMYSHLSASLRKGMSEMSAPQWSFSISAVPKVSSRVQVGRTSSKNHRCLNTGVNLIRQRVLPNSSWRAGPSIPRDACHPWLACSVLGCPVYITGGKGLLHDSKYHKPYEKSHPKLTNTVLSNTNQSFVLG